MPSAAHCVKALVIGKDEDEVGSLLRGIQLPNLKKRQGQRGRARASDELSPG
jgi:hypothetical protein